MASEFLMPKLGLTMEEGTIAEWLVGDGDDVQAGAAVLRIETDKTETDVEAAHSGRLRFAGDVGDTFACGERIGWFLADGEEPPAGSASTAAPAASTTAPASTTLAPPTVAAAATTPGGRILASPMARRVAAERNIDLGAVRGTGPGGRIVSADLDGLTSAPPAPAPAVAAAGITLAPAAGIGGIAPPATVAARQLADLLGIDLRSVALDAREGRVTRDTVALHVRGVLAAASASSLAAASTSAAAPSSSLPPAMQAPSTTIKLSGMRGTIAKRMHESLASMAQLTLHMDADLDAVVADREQRKAAGNAPSYTDYVIAATARALTQHPVVNSQITDEGVALLPTVHVGMAVALDGGLIVPVISDTATRGLESLSAESSRLAAAARDGNLTLPELEGGTFSVSTLGMFGVDGFTPVINPPNTAILGVGRLRDDVVVNNGDISTVKRLTLSLTWDHRAFDGAPAAEFCQTIATLLQDPSALDTPVSS